MPGCALPGAGVLFGTVGAKVVVVDAIASTGGVAVELTGDGDGDGDGATAAAV